MKLIKKLDIFILKNYLILFAGTFCVSLFVVMMQFLWRWVDELVGKGLSFDVLAKFFFYSGETLVSLALPLAVLLASLISFGNLGERLELLAIKAAGISLFRTLRPLIIFNALVMCVSFYFQNNIAPKAEENLMTLIYSMRQKSPEVEIPEGVFYSGIDRMNLYVKKKNKDTRMLYDVVIYNLTDGVNNAHIILADSAMLETSSDKTHMLLHLYSGEQFENMGSNALQARNVPYRRETFVNKRFIIDFDTNFNMQENEAIGNQANTKNMNKIMEGAKYYEYYCDSLAIEFYNDHVVRQLGVANTSRSFKYPKLTADMVDTIIVDSSKMVVKKQAYMAVRDSAWKAPASVKKIDFDSLYNSQPLSNRQGAVMAALQKVNVVQMDLNWNVQTMKEGDHQLRTHWVQFWTKITMALACLLFFFIGAPLGAIIRKGGLGMPVIIAVVIFIVYYIINTGGMRSGREGSIPVWIGMWLSTIVMTPLGIWFTVKSNNDSAVFNMDSYKNFFNRLFGIRAKRHITRKEVIIDDPNYSETAEMLTQLETASRAYLKSLSRTSIIGYFFHAIRSIFRRQEDTEANDINRLMEYTIDVLSNSKDRKVLMLLNYFPVMDTKSIRFYRRRKKDFKQIIHYSKELRNHIHANILHIQ